MARAFRRTPGVRPTRSGRWEARYYDDRGHQRGKTFIRKANAEAFRSTVRADLRRGTWIDPAASAAQFATLASGRLASRLNVRRSTFLTDEGCIRKHILPRFGSVPIGRIARADVQRWIKELSDAGVGADTVRRCHRLLKTILADAVEERMIPESPCRRISLPRIVRREQLFLTAAEVERLAGVIDVLYTPLIYTAAYLGCRWGELAGLKRENVDVERREIRVVGTLQDLGRDVRYVEETKTASSRRNMSLPAFCRAAGEASGERPGERLRVRSSGWHLVAPNRFPPGAVEAGRGGRRPRPRSTVPRFAPLLRRALDRPGPAPEGDPDPPGTRQHHQDPQHLW